MALLLLALLPLALLWAWVCFGGLAGDIFHLGVSMRGFPRMVGLLAALQEVCLPGGAAGIPSGCLRFYDSLLSREGGRVFCSGIAVRALLLATSLTLTMVLPLTPGRFVCLCLFRMVPCP